MDIKEAFKKDLKKFNLAPFLFVGSGFSIRYLGTESWKGLLKRFCKGGMKPFEYYYIRAGSELDQTASFMAEDFNEWWFNGPGYKSAQKEDIAQMKQIHSPLKFEIAKYFKTKTQGTLRLNKEDEIDKFKRIIVNGIITTNWDNLLELLLPDFDVFIGERGLLTSVVQGIAEIYKIHGCVSDFNSLVLTREDYDDFMEKKLYLAAKLLTIIVEHPIIFIGYSIADENVRQILKSVDYCLSISGVESKKVVDKLFFVQRINEESSEEDAYLQSYMTVGARNQPITIIKVKDFSKVYEVLAENERKISVKMLKQISSKLFEIVKSNNPSERIAAIDISDDADLDKVDFAIGVGLRHGIEKEICTYGYLPFSYDDLLEDIMLNNKNYDPIKMVEYSLPQIINRSHYTPFCKYLRNGNFLDKKGHVDDKVHWKIRKRFYEGGDSFVTKGVRKLVKAEKTKFDFKRLNPDALMASLMASTQTENEIDLLKLKNLILENGFKLLKDKEFNQRSRLRKLIRIYDWLRFGVVSGASGQKVEVYSVRIEGRTYLLRIINDSI